MKGLHDVELDRSVARLPRSIQPERDLWPDLEKRVVALRAPSALGARRRKVVVAAAALAAAAAVSLLIERPGQRSASVAAVLPEGSAVAASSALPAVVASSEGALEHAKERGAYRAAVQALEASLAEHLRDLPSRDAERLEQSLGVLDGAIQATERALSHHPASMDLQTQLWEDYQQKVDALAVIADLVGRTS